MSEELMRHFKKKISYLLSCWYHRSIRSNIFRAFCFKYTENYASCKWQEQ